MSTIALWPVNLPQALREGHGYEDQDTRARTEMQQGPPRYRSFFLNNPRRYTLRFRMHQSQLNVFEDHYRNALAGGTKPTYMPVLDHKGFRSVAVIIEDKGKPTNDGGAYFSFTVRVVSYDH